MSRALSRDKPDLGFLPRCDWKMEVFNTLVLLVFAAVSFSECGKPSLSDPLGLFEQEEVVGTGVNYVSGSVWPKPQSESRSNTFFAVNPATFQFSSVGQQTSVLSQAMARYKPVTFPDMDVLTENSLKLLATLQIKVMDPYQPLALSSDESCEIFI